VFRHPFLVSSAADGFVHVIEHDAVGYKLKDKLHVHDSSIRAVALGSDGVIETLDDEGILRAVPLRGDRFHPVLLYKDVQKNEALAVAPRSLAFSSDDRQIAATRGAYIDIWDTNGLNQTPRTIGPFSRRQIAVVFGPDDRSLITAGEDGNIEINDVDDRHRRSLGALPDIRQLVVRPRSNEVLALSGGDQIAKLKIDAPPGRKLVYRSDAARHEWLTIDKTGRWFFKSLASVYDIDSPATPKWVLEHPGGPGGLAVSPQGDWAVMANHLWDLRAASKTEARTKPTVRMSIGGFPPYDFDSSGKFLLSVDFGTHGTASTWSDGIVLSRLYTNPVRDEGVVLGYLRSPAQLQLSPTAKWAAASDRNGEVYLWPLHFDDLYKIALSVVGRNMSLAEWQRAWPSVSYRKTFPELPVSVSTIEALISSARSLGGDHKLLYQALTQWAVELADPIACRDVCMNGALSGYAGVVLRAGLAAESLSQRNPIVSDSLGIALAKSGDLQGAIERFEYFVNWASRDPSLRARKELRQAWINDLKHRRIPDDATFCKALTEGWWNYGWPPD
jgi:WD40 repeat protein